MSTPEFVPRQEPDAIATRRIAAIAFVALLVAALAVATEDLMLGAARHPPAQPLPAAQSRLEYSPVLATERGMDLQARQREALDRLGWVDRDAGIARIPIDRAVEIAAQRGGIP